VKVHRNGLEGRFDARGQRVSLCWVECSGLGCLVGQTLFVTVEGFQLFPRLSFGSVAMMWSIVHCCYLAPTAKTASGFLAAVRSVGSVRVDSRRPWVVGSVRRRHEVWSLVLAALAVLRMRRWLEVSSLVLPALAVPQMRHFESASLVLEQAGRR
jgi:hypothetical protein